MVQSITFSLVTRKYFNNIKLINKVYVSDLSRSLYFVCKIISHDLPNCQLHSFISSKNKYNLKTIITMEYTIYMNSLSICSFYA